MKKILTGALACLTAAGALAASVPASARDGDQGRGGRGGYGSNYGGRSGHGSNYGSSYGGRGGYGSSYGGRSGYGYRDHDGGGALAAGIAGLAVGAAIASDRGGYYGGDYYYDAPPPAYYAGPSYYGYYDRCHSEWRWDRYARRYVRVRDCY